MSSKVIVSIIVLLLLVVGAWYFVGQQGAPVPVADTQDPQGAQIPPSASNAIEGTAQLSADNSDAGLDADLSSIDAQVSASGEASSDASSFSDSPIEQTE